MQPGFIYDCTESFVHPCVFERSRYTGKERDNESGNDYFGARYYASSMGRFMSPDYSDDPDPIPYADTDNPQSLNLYGYVGNNPMNDVDEDGHLDCSGGATQDVVCAVTAAAKAVWGFLTSGGSGGGCTGTCVSDAPSSPPSNNPNFTPQLQTRTAATSNSSFRNSLPQFLGGPDLCANHACDHMQIQAGVMPWGMTGGLSNAVPGIMRMRLLSVVQDAKLRNIINDLYKAGSTFGDGGTADAIAYERATGRAIGGVFHSTKAGFYITALQRAINSGRLSVQESAVAQQLLGDLQQSLTYMGR